MKKKTDKTWDNSESNRVIEAISDAPIIGVDTVEDLGYYGEGYVVWVYPGAGAEAYPYVSFAYGEAEAIEEVAQYCADNAPGFVLSFDDPYTQESDENELEEQYIRTESGYIEVLDIDHFFEGDDMWNAVAKRLSPGKQAMKKKATGEILEVLNAAGNWETVLSECGHDVWEVYDSDVDGEGNVAWQCAVCGDDSVLLTPGDFRTKQAMKKARKVEAMKKKADAVNYVQEFRDFREDRYEEFGMYADSGTFISFKIWANMNYPELSNDEINEAWESSARTANAKVTKANIEKNSSLKSKIAKVAKDLHEIADMTENKKTAKKQSAKKPQLTYFEEDADYYSVSESDISSRTTGYLYAEGGEWVAEVVGWDGYHDSGEEVITERFDTEEEARSWISKTWNEVSR